MNFRIYTALPLLALILLALVAHYLHWDDRLVQVVKEHGTSEQQRRASIWLNRYRADIQARPIARLLKAETSGLTWHAPSNSLFTVTGKIPKLAQLSLDGELLREIDLLGVSDPEGVAALSDGRFALVDERSSRLLVFELPEQGNVLDLSRAVRIELEQFDDVFLHTKNKGLEGLAWDTQRSRFILAKERDPHGLYELPFDLLLNRPGAVRLLTGEPLFMRDISGLHLDNTTGHVLVLSDQSGMLLELDGHGTPVSFMSFLAGLNGLHSSIRQAEGVTMDNRGVLYVVSEPNLFYRFVPDGD